MNQEMENTEESPKIRSFTDLNVWQKGHALVIDVYRITKEFPREEQFGLTSQIRRAVISVTSNIAEGFSRNSYKEKLQFYTMALGSLTEVQNQLLVARDVGFMAPEMFKQVAEQTVVISKLANGLIKKSKSIIHNS